MSLDKETYLPNCRLEGSARQTTIAAKAMSITKQIQKLKNLASMSTYLSAATRATTFLKCSMLGMSASKQSIMKQLTIKLK